MTVKEPEDQTAAGFESLLDEEEIKGLTEDEKMARIAKKMEMKFKEEGNQPAESVSFSEISNNRPRTLIRLQKNPTMISLFGPFHIYLLLSVSHKNMCKDESNKQRQKRFIGYGT